MLDTGDEMSMCQNFVTVLRIFSLSNLSNFLFDVLKTEEETAMLRPMLLKLQTVHTLAAMTLRSLEYLESSACIAACGFDISKHTIVKDMSPIFPNQKLRCSWRPVRVVSSWCAAQQLWYRGAQSRGQMSEFNKLSWLSDKGREKDRTSFCFRSLLERCQHRTWTNALKLSSAKASVRGRKSTSRSTGGTHLTMQYSTVTIYTKTNLTIYAFLATLWPFVIQFTRGLFRVFFYIGAFFQSFRRFWLARCKSCKAQDCTSATVCSTVDLFNSCISGGF